MTDGADPDHIHASSVCIGQNGVLILGQSGSGKSGLALTLMAFGADLIADDQTLLSRRNGTLMARAPKAIAGRIEARGVGLLAAQTAGPQAVRLAVDLDKPADARLPAENRLTLLGVEIDLICGKDVANLAAVILQYLKGGRIE